MAAAEAIGGVVPCALLISIIDGQITILLDKGVSTQFIVDYSVVDNCHTSPCYCCEL